MTPRFHALLLSIAVCSPFAPTVSSAAPPTKAEIAKIVAEAATYAPGQSREALRRLEELVREPTSAVRKQLEAGLVQLLAPTATFEARRFACKELGIIGSKSALPALTSMLKSDETAGIACLALTTYPPGKADDILRAALPAAQGSARIQIITTLGDRRDAKAVKPLAPLTADADLAVAEAAVAALGKIGDMAAWKVVTAVPKAANPALQPVLTEATLRCAEAFAASGDQKAALPVYEGLLGSSQPAYIRRAAFAALLRLDAPQAQPRILQALRGSDDALKPIAIAEVRHLPSPDASQVFAAELPNLSAQEQVWLINSLSVRGDAAACSAIGNSLASTNAAVRRAAISAMDRVGDTWSVALLTRVLDRSRDPEEIHAIELALISLRGDQQTDRAIVVALRKSSGNTRAELITALARREGSSANALLLAETAKSDPAATKAALRALGKTATPKDVTPLLERLTGAPNAEMRAEAESAVAQALPRIDSPTRRSALVRAALGWAQGPESHIALLGLLPACGDPAALDALKAATVDADADVRDAAVRALADWPDGSAWDALSAIYRQPQTESQRQLALRGLVRLAGDENTHPSARLADRYRQLLAGAHTDSERRLILGALGGSAQPETLDLAVSLLSQSSVRPEAEVAVKKIARAIKAQHPKAAEAALNRLDENP